MVQDVRLRGMTAGQGVYLGVYTRLIEELLESITCHRSNFLHHGCGSRVSAMHASAAQRNVTIIGPVASRVPVQASAVSWHPQDLSKRATTAFLIAVVCIGVAQLGFAIVNPSRPGPWLGALAMGLAAVAPVKRLRDLGARQSERTAIPDDQG